MFQSQLPHSGKPSGERTNGDKQRDRKFDQQFGPAGPHDPAPPGERCGRRRRRSPGTERAVAIALATVDFCADSMDDARLLTLASREKLRRTEGLSPENQQLLKRLNDPVMRQIHRIVGELSAHGVDPQDLLDRVTFVAISVPYVAVRQALSSGADLHRMRPMVEAAVRAVLTDKPD